MAQAFFHAGEQCLLVARLGIDNPVGCQSRLCKRGCEQVLSGHAPQNAPAGSRCDPGCKKRGRCAIDRSASAAGDFMQSAKCKAAPWKFAVNRIDAERQHFTCACTITLKVGNARAQSFYGWIVHR